MKRIFISLLVGLLLTPLTAHAQRLQQQLGRGVVVSKNGSTALINWRRLAQDPEQARWNIYVNGNKLNSQPLANTNFQTQTSNVPAGSQVTVTRVDTNATGETVESEPSTPFAVKAFDLRNMFVSISFDASPLKAADFNTSYVWPIDLDGDGEMDYVVNRKSNTNELDCYVEGYLRTGEFLWTVKLGPNELSCAGQDDMITVADMDCDGKGDVVIQSSDGTQFWDPDRKTFGLYVNGLTTADTDGDGIIDYESQTTRNAPRYISIIDGMTGREKASVEQSYNQHYNRTNRSQLMGDEYNKHVGHMGIFFHDGVHPAVVMEWHMRGTGGDHHYYNLGVGYDFSTGRAGQLKELFNEPTGAPAFHQIRVGDVDGDGCDEMIVGGYTMNNTGKVLFNTGIAHGDRFRTTDIDPERPGLETFAIQQYAGDMLGQVLYDAGTGEFIKKWYLSAVGDIGRGECIDISPDHLGWEMWSTMDGSVYDAQGNKIEGLANQYPCEGIWWDNELDREVVQTSDSHYNVYIQDFFKGRLIQIASLSNWRYVTVYAKRAAFWGDIIGDWREELILLHKENGVTVGIVGFTTDYPTDVDNIYCLMEDPHYRGDCSTKGYYQSPNPGFYLGYDMPRPQLPPVMRTDLVLAPDATTWAAGSFTNFERSASEAYADGKSVLIDLKAPAAISVGQSISPSVLYAMPVRGQRVELSGSGKISGQTELWKSQQGRLVVSIPMEQTGTTVISEGTLEATTISGDVDLRARGTLAGNVTIGGQLLLEGALNYEGCRLMPGTEAAPLGTITLKQGLTVGKRVFAEMDIRSDNQQADLIKVEGDLAIANGGKLIFTIVADTEKPAPGRYKLVEYTGTFSGNLANISVRGLTGLSYTVQNDEQALWLVINEQREATDNVHWIGNESGEWNYSDENFQTNGEATEFVAGDGIVIGDDAQQTTITLNEMMPVGSVTFQNNEKTITLNGTGGISGNGKLVVKGKGRVVLNTTKSNYTGPTIIENGTVTVKELADGGIESSIGAATSAASNLQIGKATLIVNNANTSTNRAITLTDTATIQISSGVTALKGIITGSNGVLRKTGGGQLNITYAGTNNWKSTILQAGTLAMGTWNTTFGAASSPIHVTGNSTITIFDNNSTSAVPSLANAIEIDEGRTLTVNGGQRCRVQGRLLGKGTLKINFPYVRGDFSTNLSEFEGTLNPTSGQFRITSGLDLSKGTFRMENGVYAAGVQSQSGNEQNLTHRFGALLSTASDCTLSTGTWNVGYLGTSTTYAGIIGTNAVLGKYGEGMLTLTGSSTGRININEGSVALDNKTATTSALVTVNSGATVCGSGATASITVNSGGTIAPGKPSSTGSTLTVNGTLTVRQDGRIHIKNRLSRTDAIKAEGRVSLTSPCFVMEQTGQEWDPDRTYQVFTGNGTITLSGTPTFEPAIPMQGYVWDYSLLTTEGIISIQPDPTHVQGIWNENADAETPVYDLQGRKHDAPQRGINITKGKKFLKK
ncbi:MAG: hypothetical protein IJV36_07050 [Prevotella sp.]|nr:hypothetical protein [Prevotella sp.]